MNGNDVLCVQRTFRLWGGGLLLAPSGGGCRPGEAVLTTGFEAGIPPGVTIGVISEMERQGSLFSDRPFLSGRVAPAADFDTLRFVVIAANAAPGGAGR